jgi:hypothetical protein
MTMAEFDAAKSIRPSILGTDSRPGSTPQQTCLQAGDRGDAEHQSGLAWTALRNGFYAACGLDLMGDALWCGMIEAPADGKGVMDRAGEQLPGPWEFALPPCKKIR